MSESSRGLQKSVPSPNNRRRAQIDLTRPPRGEPSDGEPNGNAHIAFYPAGFRLTILERDVSVKLAAGWSGTPPLSSTPCRFLHAFRWGRRGGCRRMNRCGVCTGVPQRWNILIVSFWRCFSHSRWKLVCATHHFASRQIKIDPKQKTRWAPVTPEAMKLREKNILWISCATRRI